MAEAVLTKRDEIEQRLNAVYRLRLRGLDPRAIMQALKIKKTTYYHDLRTLRQRHQQAIQDYDSLGDMGEALHYYQQLEQEAWFQVSQATQDSAKAGFLRLCLDARQAAIKLKMDVGLLQVVPQRVQMEAKVEAAHAIEIDTETARAIAEVLLQRPAVHRATAGPEDPSAAG